MSTHRDTLVDSLLEERERVTYCIGDQIRMYIDFFTWTTRAQWSRLYLIHHNLCNYHNKFISFGSGIVKLRKWYSSKLTVLVTVHYYLTNNSDVIQRANTSFLWLLLHHISLHLHTHTHTHVKFIIINTDGEITTQWNSVGRCIKQSRWQISKPRQRYNCQKNWSRNTTAIYYGKPISVSASKTRLILKRNTQWGKREDTVEKMHELLNK